MGRWLRTWYKRLHVLIFDDEGPGASQDWSPVQSTTRAGDSDAFFEVELNRAFDRIAEQFATKPKWLLDFEAETLRQSWDHKYSQLTTDTAYTAKHVQALQVVLAIA